MKFLLGKKIGMSQMFDAKGNVTPFTLISAGPCTILQKKSVGNDGYDALQIGFEKIEKIKKIKKSLKARPYRYVKELRGSYEVATGQEINVSIFKEGDKIKISGISKGKGFQGGVKKHGFSGRGGSHGVKHEARTIGSTGTRFPQHVMKGRKMPGRMGADRISIKNVVIVKIDQANHVVAVKGAVPGRKGTLLELKG